MPKTIFFVNPSPTLELSILSYPSADPILVQLLLFDKQEATIRFSVFAEARGQPARSTTLGSVNDPSLISRQYCLAEPCLVDFVLLIWDQRSTNPMLASKQPRVMASTFATVSN